MLVVRANVRERLSHPRAELADGSSREAKAAAATRRIARHVANSGYIGPRSPDKTQPAGGFNVDRTLNLDILYGLTTIADAGHRAGAPSPGGKHYTPRAVVPPRRRTSAVEETVAVVIVRFARVIRLVVIAAVDHRIVRKNVLDPGDDRWAVSRTDVKRIITNHIVARCWSAVREG